LHPSFISFLVPSFAELSELAKIEGEIEKVKAFNSQQDKLHKFVEESETRLRRHLSAKK
jgi:hypothetical protein